MRILHAGRTRCTGPSRGRPMSPHRRSPRDAFRGLRWQSETVMSNEASVACASFRITSFPAGRRIRRLFRTPLGESRRQLSCRGLCSFVTARQASYASLKNCRSPQAKRRGSFGESIRIPSAEAIGLSRRADRRQRRRRPGLRRRVSACAAAPGRRWRGRPRKRR